MIGSDTAHTLAVFVTPHGFGHAARAAAVCESLVRRTDERWRFELFTAVPDWFFATSIQAPFTYHRVATDVGLVQESSLTEDPEATAEALEQQLPFPGALVDRLAREVTDVSCCAVLCDIAALGIAVAERAGLPSVLVENFTWDWIYSAYLDSCPELERHAAYLRAWFERCTVHVQAEPVCGPRSSGAVTVAPISRRSHQGRAATRSQLGVPEDEPMVVLSMGGIPWTFDQLPDTGEHHPWLVVPGAAADVVRTPRAVLLPHRGPVYHPDMIRASDGVVAKLGYSTVAETYSAGVPLAYITRDRFPESPPMAAWVEANMPSVVLSGTTFAGSAWNGAMRQLLELERRSPALEASGAEQVAEVVRELVFQR